MVQGAVILSEATLQVGEETAILKMSGEADINHAFKSFESTTSVSNK